MICYTITGRNIAESKPCDELVANIYKHRAEVLEINRDSVDCFDDPFL